MSRKTFSQIIPKPVTLNQKLMGVQIMWTQRRRHPIMQDIADRATTTNLKVSSAIDERWLSM